MKKSAEEILLKGGEIFISRYNNKKYMFSIVGHASRKFRTMKVTLISLINGNRFTEPQIFKRDKDSYFHIPETSLIWGDNYSEWTRI